MEIKKGMVVQALGKCAYKKGTILVVMHEPPLGSFSSSNDFSNFIWLKPLNNHRHINECLWSSHSDFWDLYKPACLDTELEHLVWGINEI